MHGESPASFVVELKYQALEYRDSTVHIAFGWEVHVNAKDKSCTLWHHAPHRRRGPGYDLAFERSKQLLESRGWRVEIGGVARLKPPITAEEVSWSIDSELAGAKPPIPKPVDFLIPPRRVVMVSDNNKSDEWDLWVVLESRPGLHRSHKIVFEEQSGQFGLATAQNIFVGFWGSFVQTLQALEAVE
jgi:hypothetical protein